MTTLDQTSPEEAVQMYLKYREPEISQTTLYEHKCRLNRFLEWYDRDDMTKMTRKVAAKYRFYRTDEVAPTTLENEIRTFRLFIRFCEDFGCVPEGVAKHIDVPTASKDHRSRDVSLEESEADAILDYLGEYHYASFKHVLFHLMWNVGARIGGVRALDAGDFRESPDPGVDGWFLDFQDRPEQGTPLKNKWKSERRVPIGDTLTQTIQDWKEHHRPDVEDNEGRKPLLATEQGRPHKTTIQRHIYGMTRPCWYGADCPEERDPDECEAAGPKQAASKCPASRSPHALRRGRATANLNKGMTKDMTSERMDMSREVLDEHYNKQTEEDKRRLQRKFLDGD